MKIMRHVLALTAMSFLAASAQADLISGLFRTGVAGSGTIQPFGSADAHYTLNGGVAFVQSPQVTSSSQTTWVTSPVAQWIGPTADHSNVSDSILYNYTTSFVLPGGTDLNSVNIAITLASDNGTQVLVNGKDTGLPLSQSQFLAFTTFSIDAQGSPLFQAGTNTLTFSVENGPWEGPNPTGLLITSITGTYAVVPEPSTFLASLVGGACLLGYVTARRRKRWTGETTVSRPKEHGA